MKVVATFHNGRDALAFLEQREVDLVLLDLFMPGMSGLELDKGMQRQTLSRIRDCLSSHPEAYLTAEQVAVEAGPSKITVRRHFHYLIGTDEVISRVDYSTGGRPRTEYRSIKGT